MALVQAFIPHSPHAKALGISIEEIEADRAVLAMPFKEELVTMGDVVHGGAISTLIDTAATVAAWATDEVPDVALRRDRRALDQLRLGGPRLSTCAPRPRS